MKTDVFFLISLSLNTSHWKHLIKVLSFLFFLSIYWQLKKDFIWRWSLCYAFLTFYSILVVNLPIGENWKMWCWDCNQRSLNDLKSLGIVSRHIMNITNVFSLNNKIITNRRKRKGQITAIIQSHPLNKKKI